MRLGLIEEHQAQGESLQWAADFLDSIEAPAGYPTKDNEQPE